MERTGCIVSGGDGVQPSEDVEAPVFGEGLTVEWVGWPDPRLAYREQRPRLSRAPNRQKELSLRPTTTLCNPESVLSTY